MLYATLNEIKAHRPCSGGWEKLLKGLNKTAADAGPLSFESILECNGLGDAIWALRVSKVGIEVAKHFSLWNAEQVLPVFESIFPEDKRPRLAIESAKKAIAEPTEENKDTAYTAAYAAYTAAYAAYTAAAYAAARAAAAAAYAADAADAAYTAAYAAAAADAAADAVDAARAAAYAEFKKKQEVELLRLLEEVTP